MQIIIQLQNLAKEAVADVEKLVDEILGKHPSSAAVIQTTDAKQAPPPAVMVPQTKIATPVVK